MLDHRPSRVRARRRSPESHIDGSPSTALRAHIEVRARPRGSRRDTRARETVDALDAGLRVRTPAAGVRKKRSIRSSRAVRTRDRRARAMRARKSRPETRDLEGRVKMGVKDGRRARRGRDRARGRESERWIGVDRARGRARRDE